MDADNILRNMGHNNAANNINKTNNNDDDYLD